MNRLWTLTERSIKETLRNPFIFLPNILISVFFLFSYQAGLSGIADLPQFEGTSYLAFIVPVVIVTSALGGAGVAGQGIAGDLESRYFTKLSLTPVNKYSIILSHILSGAFQMVLQVSIIVVLSYILGLRPPTGFAGFLLGLTLAVLWGMAFAGYSVGMALITQNAQAAQASTLLFFPLVFLTNTFVPLELIESDWLKFVATYNPTTYVLGALREILGHGFDSDPILKGLGAVALFAAVTTLFAFIASKKALRKV